MAQTRIPRDATIGQCYGPAMELTDQAEADAYFEALVESCMSWGKSREEAERVERQNLGYYAGYYGEEVRARVERLFHCSHPIFGAVAERGAPTPEESMEIGRRIGAAKKREE